MAESAVIWPHFWSHVCFGGHDRRAVSPLGARADHKALRWEARCTVSGKPLPPMRAPAFLNLDGSTEAIPRREWFIRGVARDLMGGTASSLVTLKVEKTRPGKFTHDLCISELFFIH